jgi:hypothetical protein
MRRFALSAVLLAFSLLSFPLAAQNLEIHVTRSSRICSRSATRLRLASTTHWSAISIAITPAAWTK